MERQSETEVWEELTLSKRGTCLFKIKNKEKVVVDASGYSLVGVGKADAFGMASVSKEVTTSLNWDLASCSGDAVCSLGSTL